MFYYHRFWIGGTLMLALCGCRWELPESNHVVQGSESFTLTRAMSAEDGVPTQQENPSSCLSLPEDWGVAVQASMDNAAGNAPALVVTERADLATALETELSRPGYVWRCHSAFDQPQDLDLTTVGEIAYRITPAPFESPVSLLSTLGSDTRTVRSMMALHHIYADELPELHEPRRVALSGDALSTKGNPSGPAHKAYHFPIEFAGTLLAQPKVIGIGLVTLSPDGESAIANRVPFPNTAVELGRPAVTQDRIAMAIQHLDGTLSILSSEDAKTWAETPTGISASFGFSDLYFDETSQLWVLISREVTSGDGVAYWLSNEASMRFQPVGAPMLASGLSSFEQSIKGNGDAAVLVLGRDKNGLPMLSRLSKDGWHDQLLSDTPLDSYSDLALLGDDLFIHGEKAFGAHDLFRYSLSGRAPIEKIAEIHPDNIDSFFVHNDRLFLGTPESLNVSDDHGDTWTSLLALEDLTPFAAPDAPWLPSQIETHYIFKDALLATVRLLAKDPSALYAPLYLEVVLDLHSGATQILGGSTSGDIDSISPRQSWYFLGGVDHHAYRYGETLGHQLSVERIPLAGTMDEGPTPGDGDDTDNGNDGLRLGGGSVPLLLIGGLLLAGRYRRR